MTVTTRARRRDKFDCWYSYVGEIGDPCVYCGVASSGYDHVPPLVRVADLTELDLVRGRLRKYPACVECNTHLGDINLNTLAERRKYLRERYERKFAKWLRMPHWDDQELSSLGHGLQRHIRGHSKFSEGVKRRMAVLGGY